MAQIFINTCNDVKLLTNDFSTGFLNIREMNILWKSLASLAVSMATVCGCCIFWSVCEALWCSLENGAY